MIAVLAEHRDARLHPASFEAIAAAQHIGGNNCVVLVGADLRDMVAELSAAQIDEIVLLEDERLRGGTSEGFVAAVAAWANAASPRLLIAPHTYQARDVMPRLAARLSRPLVSDCTGIRSSAARLIFTRSLLQGKISADVALEGPAPYLATFRSGAFRAGDVRHGATPATVRVLRADLAADAITHVAEPPFREAGHAIDLTRADRIVAVGRGIREQQHLALIQQLAAALGAEVAASRPVCDAGWLPMDRQVGSSGQTVAPTLYVAVGISGAIQHIVGMNGARTIVAINKDPDAPIFEIADYGIVGDLFEIVPALIAALADR